jgi:hypothetical protein
MATSDEYDNYLLKDFYMPDTSSSYEIDPINELTATVEALQYEIQIQKLTDTVMTLQRENRQMRCDLINNSIFSNYQCFTGFFQESQRTCKFLTCEVYGEIGHTSLECQVGMSFFQEPEYEKFYMINYSN